jgi:hypothetical protein
MFLVIIGLVGLFLLGMAFIHSINPPRDDDNPPTINSMEDYHGKEGQG